MALKERKLLMTPTLWNSIDWLLKCPPSWRDRAYNDLSNTLNRIWNDGNAAIKRGIAFEDALCNTPLDKWNNHKWPIAADLKEDFAYYYNEIHREGTSFQEKATAEIELDDRVFFFYGKIDVWRPDDSEPIIDIKTTANFKGASQYLSGWQHKIYCFCKKRKDFKFYSYEFDDAGVDPGKGKLAAIHTVDYTIDSFDLLEQEIKTKLRSVIEFLRSEPELKIAYMCKFNK